MRVKADGAVKIAQFLHAFLIALVAGVFWGTWFSLSRSIASISPGTFLEDGQTMIRNLSGSMPILLPAALLSAAPVMYFSYHPKPGAAFIAEAAGVLLMIAALVITLQANVPIDNLIRQWTMETLPEDWERIRDRWQICHTVRTFLSLGSLAGVLIGILLYPGERRSTPRISVQITLPPSAGTASSS